MFFLIRGKNITSLKSLVEAKGAALAAGYKRQLTHHSQCAPIKNKYSQWHCVLVRYLNMF